MNQWFRSWHNAPTDTKWRTVAKRAKVATGQVAAVVWYLLDRASQSPERGSVEGLNPEILADAFDWEVLEIERIIDALRSVGFIVDGKLPSWVKHQPLREDGSAERAKQWRERSRTQPNANEHRLDKKRVEKKNTPKGVYMSAFDDWWRSYPKRLEKPKAYREWLKIDASEYPELAKATASYATSTEARYLRYPERFLRGGFWRDWIDGEAAKLQEVKSNGNGFKSRSERNAANLRDIAQEFGFGDDRNQGALLLGPGDPDC